MTLKETLKNASDEAYRMEQEIDALRQDLLGEKVASAALEKACHRLRRERRWLAGLVLALAKLLALHVWVA